jgi:HPt (histidine-containing phosphotransfer) domain-containing protein
LERVDGDISIIQEIAKVYVEEAPLLMNQLTQAVQDRDPKKIEYYAHSLKGVVSNFSAEKAFNTALRMEQKGNQHQLEGIEQDLQQMDEELNRLTSVVQDILDGQLFT